MIRTLASILASFLLALAGQGASFAQEHRDGAGNHPMSAPSAAMHHSFENAEQWARQFDDPNRDAWQKPEDVLDALRLAPTAIVADLGAGTGYFSVRLAKRVPQGKVFAVDI